MDIIKLSIFFTIMGLSSLFVAAEFAFIRVRSTRIDYLIEEGNRTAVLVKGVLDNIGLYLSTTQLGITMCSLALGWLGESTVQNLLRPLLDIFQLPSGIERTISTIIAFLLITFVTVVVGELVPKQLTIQHTEAVAFFTARPLIFLHKTFYPLTWLLNSSASSVMRLLGLKAISDADEAHSEEELRLIVNESYKSGEINQNEYRFVNNIFEFDNRIAKEIMVPRTEIVYLSKDDSIETALTVFKEQNLTRYPVADGDKDHIVGMINAKEVLTFIATSKANRKLEFFIRPIIRVIDSIPIHDLLLKMQKERIHLAILMDEYGGTSGLVTVEDILEEIVGEIRDEFDADEKNEIEVHGDGRYVVDAKVLIEDINELLGINIEDEDIDTIGGWILAENYEAETGDTVEFENFHFKILEMEDHQIRFLEITHVESPLQEEREG